MFKVIAIIKPMNYSQPSKIIKPLIIGAGWLGSPLAISLKKSGYDVIATKQNHESILKSPQYLQEIPLFPFSQQDLCRFQQEKSLENDTFLQNIFESRQVIITIPPSAFIKRTAEETIEDTATNRSLTYTEMILGTARLAEQYGAREIIYTSSTSVYGNSSGIIHEELPAMAQTASAKAIREVEIALESSLTIPVIILRLAGLIGNGRHPVYPLSGRDNIRAPRDAINLLHITDLINAIHALLQREIMPGHFEIYNLVTPTHPNRESYYHAVAKRLNLPLPQFETAKPLLKRIIDGGKITEMGDFSYQMLDLVNVPLESLEPLNAPETL